MNTYKVIKNDRTFILVKENNWYEAKKKAWRKIGFKNIKSVKLYWGKG